MREFITQYAYAERNQSTIIPITGLSLTIPDMAISPKEALSAFSSNRLQNLYEGFYDPDGEMPEYEKLDKVQRLHALAEARERANEAREALQTEFEAAQAATTTTNEETTAPAEG